jgi:hypothetical protein
MIITGKKLGRRTFVKGVGATLGLPMLDAMVPALAAAEATKPVRRLGYVYLPMGAYLKKWTPSKVGKLTEYSPILQPMVPHMQDVTVVSNLELKNAYSPGNHATANAAFLSAAKAKMTEGSDYFLGTTVDQIAAKQIGRQTPIPSLELAMDLLTTVGDCDNGYACVYQNNLSWSSPTTPLPAEAHPRQLFQRLFGSGESAEQRQAELRKDASILDWVKDDIGRLQKSLGAGDKGKVNDYLTSIREVERRIQLAEKRTADAPAPDADRPQSVPASYAEHAKLMFDLQVLAMQADLTRIITFQLARETSNRTYPEAGVSDPHHPLSHHGKNQKKLDKLAKINTYHVSLFAYFLEKMKATPDGDGSLLDHSLYLFGSGMGDPDQHDHRDLPTLVAGGAAGRHKGGRHIRYRELTPMANLHLTLLDKVDVKLDAFADSTGKLKELYETASL